MILLLYIVAALSPFVLWVIFGQAFEARRTRAYLKWFKEVYCREYFRNDSKRDDI